MKLVKIIEPSTPYELKRMSSFGGWPIKLFLEFDPPPQPSKAHKNIKTDYPTRLVFVSNSIGACGLSTLEGLWFYDDASITSLDTLIAHMGYAFKPPKVTLADALPALVKLMPV